MTPSIPPTQSGPQVVSPTQGVPARDGDPSPFEAFLGTLRKSMTLSAFTLSPLPPSTPIQPASKPDHASTPTDSGPKQEPAAQEPKAEGTDEAENSRPDTEPAPEEPPKRKDRAEPADSTPVQPQTDPLCTPVPHADTEKPRADHAEPPKPDGGRPMPPEAAKMSDLPVVAVGAEQAKPTVQRPEPAVRGHVEKTATSVSSGTTSVHPSDEPPASKQPTPPIEPSSPAAAASGEDQPVGVEPPRTDHAAPVTTAQRAPAATQPETPIFSLTPEPHGAPAKSAAPATSADPALPTGTTLRQAVTPVGPPDAATPTETSEPSRMRPEHKGEPTQGQFAPRAQAPADQPPPFAEVHAVEKSAQPAPQPHADATPQTPPTRPAPQPHQSNTNGASAQPAGPPPADAVAQAQPPQQAPARAPGVLPGSDRAAARPIGAVAGAPAPISSKDALGKLSGQAPVLRRAVEQQSIILQTARGLTAALKNGDGTVTLSLQPPRLGQLKVHLTLADGLIKARMEPTTQAARQLLIDSEHSLRAALEARGLSVERIDVDAVKPPHTNDAAPRHDSHSAADHGQPDTPGGDNAGPRPRGGHAGSGAEAHAGSPERTEAPGSEPAVGSEAVTYALEGGGTYRLRLDALA